MNGFVERGKSAAAGVVQGYLGKGDVAEAEFGLIHQGCVTGDVSVFFKPAHPHLARRFGETHPRGKLGYRDSGVLLQLANNGLVYSIQIGHVVCPRLN